MIIEDNTAIECAYCAGPMYLMGILGDTYHFRCRNCGVGIGCDEATVELLRMEEGENECLLGDNCPICMVGGHQDLSEPLDEEEDE